jgi:REP-associated tyrosine transposase
MPNTYTKLRYRLLFGTDGEEQLLASRETRERLRSYVSGIINRRRAISLEIGCLADRMHLLLGLRADQGLAQTVGALKSITSKWLKHQIPAFSWRRGYAALSVSHSEVATVRRYIRGQETAGRVPPISEELRQLFESRSFDFDDEAMEVPTRTLLRCHVVFATKDRLPLISSDLEASLYAVIHDAVDQERGSLLEIGGVSDHVHLLLGMRPDHTVARIVKGIKGRASRWMNQLHPPFAWQSGYGAFTVGESQVPIVQRYIQRQPQHHRSMSFAEEFSRLVQRHRSSGDD